MQFIGMIISDENKLPLNDNMTEIDKHNTSVS